MKSIFWFLLLISTLGSAQKSRKAQTKADKLIITALRNHINFLADDKLEGRRTGTAGEKAAYEYISKSFNENGLLAKGEDGTYIQNFDVFDGKQINSSTTLSINNNPLIVDLDFFPLAYSANGKLAVSSSIALPESGSVWFWDLKETLEENKNNIHFDLEDVIVKKINVVATKVSAALIIHNSYDLKDYLKF